MVRKIATMLLLLPFMLLVSCTNEKNYDGKVKVVFELEGGTYQNCVLPIVHYYPFETETSNLIIDPTTLTGSGIEKAGYRLEGWYQVKTLEGENVTYTNKWNFETDYVNSEGITLYAKWEKNIKYTYEVIYYDENQEIQKLGTYEVNAGEKFVDYANYAKKRLGYTAIKFLDDNGNVWDENYVHPGGEKDLAIKVVVDYIEGSYAVVKTAKELKANKTKNIYLANDIDLGGEEFNFGDYKGIFLGNGYTISNFSIKYDASKYGLVEDFENESQKSLCISLFGRVDGATICDVTFDNVLVDVKTPLTTTYRIYVAPIGVDIKNSIIKNVNFNGNFRYSQLPTNFNIEENLIFITDKAYYIKDDSTIIENTIINVTNENQ